MYVFTDSGFPRAAKLATPIVLALTDEGVGACTGYRWFSRHEETLPVSCARPGTARLRRCCVIMITTSPGAGRWPSAGRHLIELRYSSYWKHSISGRLFLNPCPKACRTQKFITRATAASLPLMGTAAGASCWNRSTRQIPITKIYSRRLWQLAFVSQFPFLVGWWWGLGGLILGFDALPGRKCRSTEPNPATPGQLGIMIGIIYLLESLRGSAVEGCQPHLSGRENYHQSVLVGLHTVGPS